MGKTAKKVVGAVVQPVATVAGAVIGSFFGPPGTLAGAALGASIGGAVGGGVQALVQPAGAAPALVPGAGFQLPPGATLSLDFSPLAAVLQTQISNQTSVLQSLLPAVLNPLAQKLVEEVSLLGDLRTLGLTSFAPLAEELAAGSREAREILAPAVSTAAGALFQIVRAILTGKDIPPESLLAIFREALVFTTRVVGPEARFWLPHITRLLAVTLPAVLGRRERVLKFFDEDETATALVFDMSSITSTLGSFFSVEPFLKKILQAIALAGTGLFQATTTVIADAADGLRGPIAFAAEPVGRLGLGAMDLLHAPMEGAVESFSGVLFERLLDRMDSLGEATPDNVKNIAPRILATAASLGMSSHMVAVLSEQIAFLKHLGLPQLAAFLTDLAQFSGIGRHLIGAEFEAALRSPSMRRARARFRPELLDQMSMERLWLERRIDQETATQHFRELGWREDLIEPHLLELFREPTGRELAQIFEDVEIDEPWVLRMLTQSGFDDESVGKLLAGVKFRSQKSLRQALLGEIEAAFVDGVLSMEQAQPMLATLRLKEDSVLLFMGQANLHRVRVDMTKERQLLEDMAAIGQITDDELQAELAALGFDQRAQLLAARRARLRLGKRTFEAERSEIKAAIRRAQSDRVQAALDAHRRFLVEDTDLTAILQGQGVREEEISALVELARARREPVPRLPEILSPAAQLQLELQRRVDQVLALQRNKDIDEQTSIALQIALGETPTKATLEAGLVAARLTHPPAPEKPKPEPADVRATREIRTDAAIERFREGLISGDELRRQLLAFGNKQGIADSLVEREVSRAQVNTIRGQARQSAQELRDQRAALETAAVEAFRRDQFDEAGLLGNLLALGRTLDTAEAIVQREVVRKIRKPTPVKG